jgi:hypothetical protein
MGTTLSGTRSETAVPPRTQNGGTYQLRGSQIDARPLFALAPEFVGGKGVFSFAFTADTLELKWEHSIAFDGLEYPSRGAVTHLRLVRKN